MSPIQDDASLQSPIGRYRQPSRGRQRPRQLSNLQVLHLFNVCSLPTTTQWLSGTAFSLRHGTSNSQSRVPGYDQPDPNSLRGGLGTLINRDPRYPPDQSVKFKSTNAFLTNAGMGGYAATRRIDVAGSGGDGHDGESDSQFANRAADLGEEVKGGDDEDNEVYYFKEEGVLVNAPKQKFQEEDSEFNDIIFRDDVDGTRNIQQIHAQQQTGFLDHQYDFSKRETERRSTVESLATRVDRLESLSTRVDRIEHEQRQIRYQLNDFKISVQAMFTDLVRNLRQDLASFEKRIETTIANTIAKTVRREVQREMRRQQIQKFKRIFNLPYSILI
ncbi:hypothetical protein FGO68_gene7401 [Halteria grandinella]|uniref:Uncharacterized protein n=1 Tax=Halteria grandinella TaxID=5974 RepID=A0A8J8NMX1_HALGN|nr:hypothetical protein FGO68_gene7401 [Halteria grandinella]